MKKISKVFLLSLLAFAFSFVLGVQGNSYAAGPWDGKTIDVTWFDEATYDTTNEYTISTPEELMGLAAIVNGIYNPGIQVIGDDNNTKIVPVEYKNVLIIPFDGTVGNIRWGKYDFEGKTIKLDADLDMGGKYNNMTKKWDKNSPNYMPIGGSYSMVADDPRNTLISSVFNGSFDGQGHTINNIYFERYAPDHFGYSQALGFIGSMGFNGKVNEIDELKDQEFELPKGSSVMNVKIGRGYMSGRRMVGGIVGRVGDTEEGVRVINCSNEAEIIATDKKGVGGIVGALWDKDASVEYCYNKGMVSNIGNFIAGGIVGSNDGIIKHCYNTGLVRSYEKKPEVIRDETAAADIAKITNEYTSYVENCYWEERDDNRGRKGVSQYYSDAGVIIDCYPYSEAQMKSQELVTNLNRELAFFKQKSNDYPVLKYDSDTNKVNVTIENPENAEIISTNSGSLAYGSAVILDIKPNPSLEVDYFTVNGAKIEGNLVLADKNLNISMIAREPNGYNIVLPEKDSDYSLSILRTGRALQDGEFVDVKDQQIFTGDKVYDGNKLKVVKTISPGNASVRYLEEKLTGTEKEYDAKNEPFYQVKSSKFEDGENSVIVSIKKHIQTQTWLNFADTKWYDENPDATEFTIKNHQELAGLSKILNLNDEKYGNETFKGKTINLITDVRFRNDKNNFQGENLPFIPIGNLKPFEGTFDGHNKRISNIVINESTENHAGLFAIVKGSSNSPAVIKNVSVEGEINLDKGGSDIGGVAGKTLYADISNVKSYVSIKTSRKTSIGGVVGKAEFTKISNAENIGNIDTKQGFTGGIAGSIDSGSSIDSSRNTGNIYQGPFVSAADEVTVGGVVGISRGNLSKVANRGRVVGYYWTGGIAGFSDKKIVDAYSTGDVVSLGSFIDISAIGTLAGRMERVGSSLENTYTVGNLRKSLNLNDNFGYLGIANKDQTYLSSYYLEDTLETGNGLSNVLPKSMVHMKSQDFIDQLGASFVKDNYHINNDYPVFDFENIMINNMSIEDFRQQCKEDIEKYPIKDFYDDENLQKVELLIDEYLKKFDIYTNEKPNTTEVKTEMRAIVNEFRQKVDEIPKKNIDEEKIKRERLDQMLIESIEKLYNRLIDPKLPKTENVDKGRNILDEANDLVNQSNTADIEVEQMIRKVNGAITSLPLDNTPPIIYNLNPVEVIKGSSFNPLEGVMVTDDYEGAPEPKLTVEGTVNTDVVGEYTLTYIAEDSVGNKTERTRKITVIESNVDLSKYDLNEDGNVNMQDVLVMQRTIKLGTEYSEETKKYDLNNDKLINALDSTILYRVVAK